MNNRNFGRFCGVLTAFWLSAGLCAGTVFAEPDDSAAETTLSADQTGTETTETTAETTEETTSVTTRDPVSAMTYEETANGLRITSYTWLNELSVTIPVQIDGKTVSEIGPNAFQYCYADEIRLPASLLIIHDSAFAGCAYLKTVKIPTGCRYIGSRAFAGCELLETVSIPSTVTDIGADAFAGTPYFSGLSGDFVTLGKGVLCAYRGESDTPVIPDSVLTVAPKAFDGCTGVRKVTVPDTVKRIQSRAFDGCTALTQIELNGIPDEVAADAFAGTKWETEPKNGLLLLNGLLYACRDTAVSVTVPDGVKVIGEGAFADNEKIAAVQLPDSVEEIRRDAFSGDTALFSLRIGTGLRKIGRDAFAGCEKLTELYLPDTLESIGENAAGYRYNAETGAAEKMNNGLTLYADAEAAKEYAQKHGLKLEPLPESEQTVPEVTETTPPETHLLELPEGNAWIPPMLCGGVLLLAGIVVFIIRKVRK